MKLAFYSMKFRELSKYIYYYYWEINNFEAMRNNLTRRSKVRYILNLSRPDPGRRQKSGKRIWKERNCIFKPFEAPQRRVKIKV